MTAGWKLDPAERAALLAVFRPRYDRLVADHVTCKPDPVGGLQPVEADIVGRADDDAGVEALIVEIAGSPDRPDGSTWHVTWSLGEGREAKESNAVIAEHGWKAVGPYALRLTPATWP